MGDKDGNEGGWVNRRVLRKLKEERGKDESPSSLDHCQVEETQKTLELLQDTTLEDFNSSPLYKIYVYYQPHRQILRKKSTGGSQL